MTPGSRLDVDEFSDRETPDDDRPVRLIYTAHAYPGDSERAFVRSGDSFTIGVGYVSQEAIDDVVFSLEINDDEGNPVARTDSDILDQHFDLPAGPGLVNFELGSLPMLDGRFSYSVGIHSRGGVLYDLREPADHFEVMNPGRSTGFISIPTQVFLHPPDPTAPTEADIVAQTKARAEEEKAEKAEKRRQAQADALDRAKRGESPTGVNA